MLAVLDNGDLQCLSADLKVERWTFQGSSDTGQSKPSRKVILSKTIPIPIAKKSILKNRLESLAGHQVRPGDAILIMLYEKSKIVEATVYLVSNFSSVSHLRTLTTIVIREPEHHEVVKFVLHDTTSTLLRYDDRSVTSYDLSQIQAMPSSALDISDTVRSVLPTSSTNILISTTAGISLHNTKYGALHSSTLLTNKTGSGIDLSSEHSEPLYFLDYAPETDVAVGYNSFGISAVQLSRTGRFLGDSLLDSLCKGVAVIDVSKHWEGLPDVRLSLAGKIGKGIEKDAVLIEEEKRIRSTLKNLADYAKDEDVFGFEKEFADFVGLERNTSVSAIQNGSGSINGVSSANGVNGVNKDSATANHLNGSSNLIKEDELPEFVYPISIEDMTEEEPKITSLSQSFVAAVLRLLFKPVEAEAGSQDLELVISVPNVFKFLLLEGYFSCTNLPGQGKGFVHALAKYDLDLNLLLFFLENASNTAIPLNEIITSVKVVMRDLISTIDTPVNATDDMDEDLDVNEESFDDEQLQEVAKEVESALEDAQLLLDLNDVQERILRAALLRVGRFSKAATINALRDTLNGAELAGLIRILRRELVRDAEERDAVNVFEPEDRLKGEADNVQEEEWLGLICDLLTNAVDAAGMTGLLLAKDTLLPTGLEANRTDIVNDEAEDFEREELLLESLSSEVSDACDALEGASYVSEILLQFLLQSEARREAGMRRDFRKSKEADRKERKSNLQMVEREKKRKAVLPMGYPPPVTAAPRSRDWAVQTKMNRRSQKVRQGMAVGAYTLERIDI